MDCFFNPIFNPIQPILGNSMLSNHTSDTVFNDPGFSSRSFSSRTSGLRLNKSEFDHGSHLKKRKLFSNGNSQKVVEDEQDDRDSKRLKTIKNKGIEDDEKTNEKRNDEDKKAPEPPKDYIHVRARRGEATDSHSLAERVRREKIGGKMKLLQDLVPGCNKVNGKALMLDEIINYVQSLQCQVEYLSVKLASVDPSEVNTDSVLPKDVTNSVHLLDSSFQAKTNFSTHCSLDHSESTLSTLYRDIGVQLPFVDNLGHGYPQFLRSYEDDLQSIVQMGFGQNPSNYLEFHSQSFPGSSDTTT